MASEISVQYRLASRPDGRCRPSDFVRVETPLAPPRAGEVLLRTIYVSLDPYVRGRMNAGPSYVPPMEIGDVIDGSTICEVVASESERYQPGAVVLGRTGWQSHAVVPDSEIRPLDRRLVQGLPLSTALGVLGMPGFTAYAGLLQIGRPEPGETVVVAAATGPVGSVVGQIAALRGARAVGVAGGPVKAALLTERLGFDVGIDHRGPELASAIAHAVPAGVDVYFENVGGAVTHAVIPHLNKGARMPVCGIIADYDEPSSVSSTDRLPWFMRRILDQSLLVQGFLAQQFVREHYKAFQDDMSSWIRAGSVVYLEDVVDGLENAPEAFIGMLSGSNMGKLVIRVGEDPSWSASP